MTKYFNRQKVIAKMVQTVGHLETPGSTEVTVLGKDNAGLVTDARGETVPAGEAGYAQGAFFLDTNKSGHNLYVNIGDDTAASWDLSGEVTPSELQAEIVDSWSESPTYDVVRVLPASLFDGNANTIFSLPNNTFATDVVLVTTSGAGVACTVDVGTDDADWSFHNNDPNAFIEAFDVENAGGAVRMTALDVASQAAAAQSGDGISTGSGDVILTSSADVSGSNVSVIATLKLTKLDPNTFV